MENIKLLLLGGLNLVGSLELFVKVIDHEPTIEDKKIFLEETIKKYGSDNQIFPVKNLKLENVKILDCEDKILPIDNIKHSYFNTIKIDEEE